MNYNDKSPLSKYSDEELTLVAYHDLIGEIKLFRKALQYCLDQRLDDHCWMDYRHLLMRFSPNYNPETDDVILDVNQLDNCKNFIACWQNSGKWDCLGGDKGKSVDARSIGTLECLKEDSLKPVTQFSDSGEIEVHYSGPMPEYLKNKNITSEDGNLSE